MFFLSFGRSLTGPSGTPLRLSFKNNGRHGHPSRQRRAYGGTVPERQVNELIELGDQSLKSRVVTQRSKVIVLE